VAALPNFRIETVQTGSGTTIALVGELDNAACAELLDHFEAANAGADARNVMLDLSEVSFIDSAGMRAIIAIERRVSELGLTLSITPPPPEVTELLRVTGIVDRVPLTPRVDTPPPNEPFIERIELDLPRDPNAPGRARAELRGALAGRISESDRGTLTLLTSELVTNAVIHPGAAVEGSVGLRITAYADRIRIEVDDAGFGFELENLPARPRETGGHGLVVVDGLSSRWGTSRVSSGESPGFCVWFELDVEYAPQAPADLPEATDTVGAAEG
jgi:anti-anti-sigma factor